MSQKQTLLCALWVLWGPGIGFVAAQRGVGDPEGIARQGVRPEIVTLEGRVVEVRTGPCENTTGRSWIGTHVLLETPEGEPLNIHLGPAGQVEFLARELEAGLPVKVQGFRTDQLQEGHYVAQTVAYGDRTVHLRDANLRPVWAGGRGAGGGWGYGPGPGMGRGRGAGFGYGYQRGWGQGRGYGAQRGRGPRW
ncbi:MAG: hypothetical protein MUF48_12440 [Pirellulaceae bacterium]|jgi:hypothetical protein|nr:hypothetical protein [Pirellulaceae bacterium]